MFKLLAVVSAQILSALRPTASDGAPQRLRGERGQTVAEYALVILGAASVALLLLTWAGGTGRIAELLDTVVDGVLSNIF